MKFLGQYSDLVENGRVGFPWEVSDGEKLIWMIAEVIGNDFVEIRCEIHNSDEFMNNKNEGMPSKNEIRIISKGDVLLDPDNVWQVPGQVSEYLKANEITFLGAFNFVEIFSREDMEKCSKLPDELMEIW